MYPKYSILLFLFLTSLAFVSCSDDPDSIGESILNPNDPILLNVLSSDSLQQSSSYFALPVELGLADWLLLGKYQNDESSILIKFSFSAAPDSIIEQLEADSIQINSAYITMPVEYYLKNKDAALSLSAHNVTSYWKTDSIGNLNYDPADIASGFQVTDSLITININNDIAKTWFNVETDDDTSTLSYGIYLKPVSADKILGFTALGSVLTIELEKLGGVYKDTLEFTTSMDMHIVLGDLPSGSPDLIFVQGGLAVNSLIKFDLPALSQRTIVNQAILEISINEELSHLGTPHNDSLLVKFLESEITDSIADYDSTRFILLKKSGDKFVGDIAQFVHRWISGEVNYGIIISLYNEENTLDYFALYGSQAEKAKRPLLKILYSKN